MYLTCYIFDITVIQYNTQVLSKLLAADLPAFIGHCGFFFVIVQSPVSSSEFQQFINPQYYLSLIMRTFFFFFFFYSEFLLYSEIVFSAMRWSSTTFHCALNRHCC